MQILNWEYYPNGLVFGQVKSYWPERIQLVIHEAPTTQSLKQDASTFVEWKIAF
jgi:hypothetical protein